MVAEFSPQDYHHYVRELLALLSWRGVHNINRFGYTPAISQLLTVPPYVFASEFCYI